MLCALILYVIGGTYSLKSRPNERFFEKFFMTSLSTLRVFGRVFAESKSPKKYFHIFALMSNLGSEIGLYVYKPTHCLLDYEYYNVNVVFSFTEKTIAGRWMVRFYKNISKIYQFQNKFYKIYGILN